jgi:hypothetical protein
MGRIAEPQNTDAVKTWCSTIRADYLSQTDTALQSVASTLSVAGLSVGSGMTTITQLKLFAVSGVNPITFAHGMTGTPKCVVSANAAQPYAIAWTSDGANITIRHNSAGSLTVTVIAWI